MDQDWKIKPRTFLQSEGLIQAKAQELTTKGYHQRKPLVWVVSNCHTQSKREDIVAEIQKLLPVDIYGSCGTLSCPKETDNDCMTMIDSNYKFYIRCKIVKGFSGLKENV